MLASTSTDTGDILELKTMAELEQLMKSAKDILDAKKHNQPKAVVVLCCASWYEPCGILKDGVFPELAKVNKHIVFSWIDCDQFLDLVDKHQVETAPTVLVFHTNTDDVEKLVNPSPEELSNKMNELNEAYQSLSGIKLEIESVLNSSPMVAFIKGIPSEPKCKFTRRLLGHFKDLEIENFKHFNILENQKIRSWLKVYSNWKTYPQVYINGEFVGGIDVVSELVEEGEFIDMVPDSCKKLPPTDMFEQMLASFDVVVLIDGLPDKPNNDASKSLISTLNDNSIKYVTVDFSSLESEVKEHIKSKYGVSESPHIFLKKTSFGNEETLSKVISSGKLDTTIPEGSRKMSLNDKLKKLISKYRLHIIESPTFGHITLLRYF